jgi:hypothetical protein
MSCRSPYWMCEDYGIARRRKLFIGTEFERGALVQEDLFVWPPHGAPQRVRSGKLAS